MSIKTFSLLIARWKLCDCYPAEQAKEWPANGEYGCSSGNASLQRHLEEQGKKFLKKHVAEMGRKAMSFVTCLHSTTPICSLSFSSCKRSANDPSAARNGRPPDLINVIRLCLALHCKQDTGGSDNLASSVTYATNCVRYLHRKNEDFAAKEPGEDFERQEASTKKLSPLTQTNRPLAVIRGDGEAATESPESARFHENSAVAVTDSKCRKASVDAFSTSEHLTVFLSKPSCNIIHIVPTNFIKIAHLFAVAVAFATLTAEAGEIDDRRANLQTDLKAAREEAEKRRKDARKALERAAKKIAEIAAAATINATENANAHDDAADGPTENTTAIASPDNSTTTASENSTAIATVNSTAATVTSTTTTATTATISDVATTTGNNTAIATGITTNTNSTETNSCEAASVPSAATTANTEPSTTLRPPPPTTRPLQPSPPPTAARPPHSPPRASGSSTA
ncbi:hypothetical protein BDK51DRAFT_51089 [Blyttiomyces helicus]|uniref:Uncharacterized protein n=1 Tax=Blyttiomyces helicus TaxID=388810 RepID=A0A4P9W3K5_9FUNG|nr:hypothetical protein BDK51DRAFT_51089 [Blyttiomyces helicus]|eukprot:RKO85833.1 hypothetical protein BDK51DRAFT_51089 [Blyttiomyces helicus]